MKTVEDDFIAPRGKPISGDINQMPEDYVPGKDKEFDFGFQRNFQEGGLVNMGGSEEAMGQMNQMGNVAAAARRGLKA